MGTHRSQQENEGQPSNKVNILFVRNHHTLINYIGKLTYRIYAIKIWLKNNICTLDDVVRL